MQSHPGYLRNFKLISKFSYMPPVFPDYLPVSYDYGSTQGNLIKPVYKINRYGEYSITVTAVSHGTKSKNN